MSTYDYLELLGTTCPIEESVAASAILQQLGGIAALPRFVRRRYDLNATADSLYIRWGAKKDAANTLQIKLEEGGTYTVTSYRFNVKTGMVKKNESTTVAAAQLTAKIPEATGLAAR